MNYADKYSARTSKMIYGSQFFTRGM